MEFLQKIGMYEWRYRRAIVPEALESTRVKTRARCKQFRARCSSGPGAGSTGGGDEPEPAVDRPRTSPARSVSNK
ncbi:MAG: hypothetical protein Kow0020_12250 [Wenzhouxiangellaceae bacterium]